MSLFRKNKMKKIQRFQKKMCTYFSGLYFITGKQVQVTLLFLQWTQRALPFLVDMLESKGFFQVI